MRVSWSPAPGRSLAASLAEARFTAASTGISRLRRFCTSWLITVAGAVPALGAVHAHTSVRNGRSAAPTQGLRRGPPRALGLVAAPGCGDSASGGGGYPIPPHAGATGNPSRTTRACAGDSIRAHRMPERPPAAVRYERQPQALETETVRATA